MGNTDAVRALLDRVYEERCHGARHDKDAYQLRVNLQKKDDAASYAGFITAENPTSGPCPPPKWADFMRAITWVAAPGFRRFSRLQPLQPGVLHARDIVGNSS